MTAPDLFGLVVRTIGLLLTVYALWHVVYGLGLLGFKESQDKEKTGNHLRFGIAAGIVGFLLVFGADWITKWTY